MKTLSGYFGIKDGTAVWLIYILSKPYRRPMKKRLKMNLMTIENLLNKALSSDCGVSVTLPEAYIAHHCRRKLYAERERLRLSGINTYDSLSFLVRNKTELWIVKRDVFNPPQEIGFESYRPIMPSELPSRILSRGKSRAFLDNS